MCESDPKNRANDREPAYASGSRTRSDESVEAAVRSSSQTVRDRPRGQAAGIRTRSEPPRPAPPRGVRRTKAAPRTKSHPPSLAYAAFANSTVSARPDPSAENSTAPYPSERAHIGLTSDGSVTSPVAQSMTIGQSADIPLA